ncbi:MAG: GNAT family N-acetyltransferase [Flavobacteriales bacterium]|nr:GNAT family N-acetyltransferase [Flavobacteriales bacterium]
MKTEINRYYLEIHSSKELKESREPSDEFEILKINPPDFQLNKFFYKNVGKKHRWIDRLVWTDIQWTDYVNDSKVDTFILKQINNMIGYFELIYHKNVDEVEIAYLGLLEEHLNKKLGSFLLYSALKKSFLKAPKRIWVHTCSLDHKNALSNYLDRGMKVFKEETLSI